MLTVLHDSSLRASPLLIAYGGEVSELRGLGEGSMATVVQSAPGQSPLQKLLSSFMSSHSPEIFASRTNGWTTFAQYRAASGCRKSANVVVPGQTLPTAGSPEESLIHTPMAVPTSYGA